MTDRENLYEHTKVFCLLQNSVDCFVVEKYSKICWIGHNHRVLPRNLGIDNSGEYLLKPKHSKVEMEI